MLLICKYCRLLQKNGQLFLNKRQMKMSLLRLLIIFVLLRSFDSTDLLLKMSQDSNCIKTVVAKFASSSECKQLPQDEKSMLSLEMTFCLLRQMNKEYPKDCEECSKCHDNSECRRKECAICRLEGDAWTAFSTFYTHIDNLCHFYWEVLHHERAEDMIVKLSNSASSAADTLSENLKQTQQILGLQKQIAGQMLATSQGQKQLQSVIRQSTSTLSNFTMQMQKMLLNIHNELTVNHDKMNNLIEDVSASLDSLNTLQQLLLSQFSTVYGAVYYMLMGILLIIVTSGGRLNGRRAISLFSLGVNLVWEIVLGHMFAHVVSRVSVRLGVIVFILVQLMTAPQHGSKELIKMALHSAMKQYKMPRRSNEM